MSQSTVTFSSQAHHSQSCTGPMPGQTGGIAQSASSPWKPGLLLRLFSRYPAKAGFPVIQCVVVPSRLNKYKKGFEKSKTHFHLPMDMVIIRHAKKAKLWPAFLDCRKKLHEYTVLPEDMKTLFWAKKAYGPRASG